MDNIITERKQKADDVRGYIRKHRIYQKEIAPRMGVTVSALQNGIRNPDCHSIKWWERVEAAAKAALELR